MKMEKIVCHSLMGLALIYLFATRYYIYIHLPELNKLDFIRAVTANISYIFIFIMAYWLSHSSRKMVLNSILGFFSIILSPAIMPLVGYVGLLAMFAIRKVGNKKYETLS